MLESKSVTARQVWLLIFLEILCQYFSIMLSEDLF